MSQPAQRSFAGGEIAPALYARTDQVKYATGLRTCRNFFIQRHGGAAMRPGTRFIAETKNSGVACRLIKFVKDSTDIGDTFVLELGNQYARFYQNGGQVVTSGVSAWVTATAYTVGDLVTQGGVTYYCTLAHTSANGTDKPGVDGGWGTKWYALTGSVYEIPTPYTTADLPDLQYAQQGDIITLAHPSYAPRELRRYGATRWVLAAISFGPSIASPLNVNAAGGAAGVDTYYAVTAVKELTLEESLPAVFKIAAKIPTAANPIAVTWNPVAGAVSYNAYRSLDGLTFGLISSAGGTNSPQSDNTWGTTDSVADATTAVWTDAPAKAHNALAAISITQRAADGKYTIASTTVVTGQAGSVGPGFGQVAIFYSRNGETPINVGTIGEFGTVDELATSYDSTLTIDVPDNGYTTLDIYLLAQAQTNGALANEVIVDVTGTLVSWTGPASSFSDAGAAPEYSIAPPSEPQLFATRDTFPAATGNYQQRRVFGNTSAEPDTVYASRVASYASFAKSTPLQDDDMIQFALVGKQTPVVKHLLDLDRLLVFTTAGVYMCGDSSAAFTPTSVNPRRVASQGAGRLRPLEVGDSAVYVQGRQTIVRDLQPWSSGGALGGYQGRDLTVFAAHLFLGFTLVDWDYAELPHSVLWVVRSDGTLLGLTYLREEATWGWHRHDTAGAFENVVTVPEGSEDAVYVVVRRTVNGATKRYVERFTSRFFTDIREAVFMDSALSFDGRNTTVTTMELTGGTLWDGSELLTITATGGTPFVSTNVGDAVFFTDNEGNTLQVNISSYTSSSVVQGRALRAIPPELQAHATAVWTLAVSKVSGMSHIAGMQVSVLGDGYVAGSPNNPDYLVPLTVDGSGNLTLPQPFGIIHVGLPYIADIETLDLDSPGPRSTKDKKSLVTRVGLFVEASRGIWTGRSTTPTAADPTNGLEERKPRRIEDYSTPPDAFTGYIEQEIKTNWDNNGGVLVRQIDPVPLTVLAAMPFGFFPT